MRDLAMKREWQLKLPGAESAPLIITQIGPPPTLHPTALWFPKASAQLPHRERNQTDAGKLWQGEAMFASLIALLGWHNHIPKRQLFWFFQNVIDETYLSLCKILCECYWPFSRKARIKLKHHSRKVVRKEPGTKESKPGSRVKDQVKTDCGLDWGANPESGLTKIILQGAILGVHHRGALHTNPKSSASSPKGVYLKGRDLQQNVPTALSRGLFLSPSLNCRAYFLYLLFWVLL